MSFAAEAVFEAIDERTRDILALRAASKVVRRRGQLVRRALLAADIVGLTVAFLIAHLVYGAGAGRGALSDSGELVLFTLSLPLWLLAARIYRLYDQDEETADHSTADEFVGLFHLMTVGTFLLFAASRLTQWFRPELGKLLLFWMLGVVATATCRGFARAMCRRSIQYLQNTLIVGAGDAGQDLARKLLSHREYGLNLVGFVDSNPKTRADDLEHLTMLGGLSELADVVELLDVERAFVAFTSDSHEELLGAVTVLRRRDVHVDIVPRLFENLDPSTRIHSVEGIPLVSIPPMRLSSTSLVLKRGLDLVVATMALLTLSPLLVLIAFAVKCDTRGPVFYRHKRVGRRWREISVLKFRTMHIQMCRGDQYGGEEAERAFETLLADPANQQEFSATYKLQHDPRVTRVGAFLRRTSLDELPQLWNVVRGDLSLVGPRALTGSELLEYYGDAVPVLLESTPGITGYWQINGRSNLAYRDRVRLDLAYISGWSLALDLLILAKTLRVILSRSGAV